jgi:DNA-binding HxlR family transcriptional regulator
MSPDDKKYCPIIRPTKLVGDTWTLLIIKSLLPGSKRFNQIREEIPEITSRTLSQRLKFLCEQGLLSRKQYPEIPPKVEYTLTKMGEALEPIIVAVENFGNDFMC